MFYVIDEDSKLLLEHVKDVLYSPKIKTGDQIRDCAQQVLCVLDSLIAVKESDIKGA